MSANLILSIEAELSPARFAELGRPAGAYRHASGAITALASDFERLYWPGRAIYNGHQLRHRLSLYRSNFRTLVAVFDGASFPINDVAFHPVRPLLAIATGSYDGGYCFEGELLLWNWESGETIQVLSESREVSRVRFVNQNSLAVLLRPRNEEEFGEAFDTFIGGTLADLRAYRDFGLSAGDADPRISGFEPRDPASLGFDCGVFSSEAHAQHWDTLFRAPDYERRHRVWDVAWNGADQVLAVHDCCHLEIWRPGIGRVFHRQGNGHGVQILKSPAGVFVHVIERANFHLGTNDRSLLLQLNEEEMVTVAAFDSGMLFSVDRFGRFLCRDTGSFGKRKGIDCVISADKQKVLARDLGHYDCFNHHLRLDGAQALYFLRGNPPSSHERKVLCSIEPSGKIAKHFSWDMRSSHLMDSTACFLPDGNLARAYRVYDPNPSRFAGFIEVLKMPSGRLQWKQPIPALVTTLACEDGIPWLFYGLTDGTIGIFNWSTGERCSEQLLRVGEVNTMALCLALRQGQIACGTLDGRVLLMRVQEGGNRGACRPREK